MTEAPSYPQRSFFDLLFLSFRSKCPVCGNGRLFSRVSELNGISTVFLPIDRCELCHFKFSREAGYYFGCIFPVLPILSLPVAGVFATVAYFGLHMEIDQVVLATLVGAGVGFFGLFRTAVRIYISVDLALNPPRAEEFIFE